LKFVQVPDDPQNIVLGQNSTNIILTWTFDLEGTALTQMKIVRYQQGNAETPTRLCIFASNTALVESPNYELNASSSSNPGYASLTIKDVTNQSKNIDGTKVDVLTNKYVYKLEIDVLSSLPTLADTVKLQVFGKTLHLI
jgi:hypothetical protein